MIRSATILAFPTGRLSMQDRADLARWGAISSLYGWRAGAEGGPAVDTTQDGQEHVRIMLRALDDDAVYFISRERGGWTVLDRRGAASVWASLLDALESICPTRWHRRAPVRAAPGQLPA
jgi:hypothetical protein